MTKKSGDLKRLLAPTTNMYTHLIIHYAEIGTKGNNRPLFENQLKQNCEHALKALKLSVKKAYGRLLIHLNEKEPIDQIITHLQAVFGIASISPAIHTEPAMEKMKEAATQLIAGNEQKTIAVITKRTDKRFPQKSADVNKVIGTHLVEKHGCNVNLSEPEFPVYIEITEKGCFVYSEKHQGLGGLPVGSSGTVVSLLSGGIDSPVSSYLLMKRGCPVVLVHCYNTTINTKAALEKVTELAEKISRYQPATKLYLIPFADIQQAVIKTVPADTRMLVYRRMMLRIAEAVMKKEKGYALVTGESVGQVASQTLPNMASIDASITTPVIRPLAGFDKEEIITKAKAIGTFETSILPYEDCCSFMVAQHPKTKTTPDYLDNVEQPLEIKTLVEEAISKATLKTY